MLSQLTIRLYDLSLGLTQPRFRICVEEPGLGLPTETTAAEYRSISPKGQYAWARSKKYTFFVDNKLGKVTIVRKEMPYLLGVDGRFGDANFHATVMEVRDYKTMQAWSWRPLGHNRTLTPISLYNAFSNNGLWFKGIK